MCYHGRMDARASAHGERRESPWRLSALLLLLPTTLGAAPAFIPGAIDFGQNSGVSSLSADATAALVGYPANQLWSLTEGVVTLDMPASSEAREISPDGLVVGIRNNQAGWWDRGGVWHSAQNPAWQNSSGSLAASTNCARLTGYFGTGTSSDAFVYSFPVSWTNIGQTPVGGSTGAAITYDGKRIAGERQAGTGQVAQAVLWTETAPNVWTRTDLGWLPGSPVPDSIAYGISPGLKPGDLYVVGGSTSATNPHALAWEPCLWPKAGEPVGLGTWPGLIDCAGAATDCSEMAEVVVGGWSYYNHETWEYDDLPAIWLKHTDSQGRESWPTSEAILASNYFAALGLSPVLGSLEIRDVSDVNQDGYYVSVNADDADGYQHGLIVPVRVQPVGLAKTRPDKMPVLVEGVLTAVFPECMYIQGVSRAAGLRIEPGIPPADILIGDTVRVLGSMHTGANSERFCDGYVTKVNSGPGAARPLCMRCECVGRPTGASTRGMLVRTWGRVKARQPGAFTLDCGLSCALPEGTPAPASGDFVKVTGIAGLDSAGLPLLAVRMATDIEVEL